MRARFYFIDGRITEDVNLDPRARRHALEDHGRIRWFVANGDTDADGFAVLHEAPDSNQPQRRVHRTP